MLHSHLGVLCIYPSPARTCSALILKEYLNLALKGSQEMASISWKLLKRGVGVLRKGQECEIPQCFRAVCLLYPSVAGEKGTEKSRVLEPDASGF